MDFSAMAPIAILKSSHTFRDTMNYWYNANKCEIWQAARCTSAAPSFFRTMFVDVPAPGSWYIDGGLCHNNPSPCNTLSFSESTRMITLLRADWPISANSPVEAPSRNSPQAESHYNFEIPILFRELADRHGGQEEEELLQRGIESHGYLITPHRSSPSPP
jgi:predicted acylesterase/phospholipase RssA